MRFLLAFVLSFVSVFAIAQAPPMVIGGPQGIDVTRILSRNWMAIPIMTDTPAVPLTGAGWPGRGYIVHVAKANDTTVWHYTGGRWQRIGGAAENRFTQLITGGGFTRSATLNRFTVEASTYYINGQYYSSPLQLLLGTPKAQNANGRIDVVALDASGPVVIAGTEATNPVSPTVASNRIKLGFVYYRPFDSLPTLSGNGIDAIFRKPGVDSIFFSTGDTTLSIKDSIGISRNDTAAMLNPYKFSAANGLTKDSTVFRLGGTLNQNTNIELNSRRLTFIGGADTTRFFGDGRVSISGTPDSSGRFFLINKKSSRLGNLEINVNQNALNTGNGIRIDGVDQTFKLQGSNGNPSFQFANWVNDTTPSGIFASSKDNIRINLGFSRSAGPLRLDTLTGNVLNIMPKHNIFYDSGFTILRGIYYNPTIQELNKTIHVAYQNTTGSNLLNSTSGNTRIGYNTSDTTFKLDVNGTARISDTLTLTTTPVTSDTTANDLLVINSSNGQVRRYTGAWYNNPLEASDTLDFPSTGHGTSSDLTITVVGAAVGDVVSLGIPNAAMVANISYTAWVSATDTVTVRLDHYASSGNVDPVSATFKVKVFK